MIKKESKFSIVATIALLATIACLCLLFPIKVTEAESDASPLKITGVVYGGSNGFVIRTDDKSAGTAVDLDLISVYDKNGNEMTIDPENFFCANGRMTFSLAECPEPTRLGGGKVIFGKGFRVSAGGRELLSDDVWISESADKETGVVTFYKQTKTETSEVDPAESSPIGETDSPSGSVSGSENNSETESENNSEISSASESESLSDRQSDFESNSESEESSESESEENSESESEEISESDEPFPIDEPAESESTNESEEISASESTDESKETSESKSTNESEEISASESTNESKETSESESLDESESGDSESNSVSDSESNSESESESESDSNSESESDSNSDSESDSDSESKSGGEVVRPPFNIGGNNGGNKGKNGSEVSDDGGEVSSVKIEEIRTGKDFYVLKIGEEATISLTVLPENATEKYSCSFTADGVATYENFTIKGVAAGETELTFKAENAEKSIKIIVIEDGETYTVTPEFGDAVLKIKLSENVLFGEYVYSEEEKAEAAKFIRASGCKISAVRTEASESGNYIVIEFTAADENSYAIVGKGFPIYSSLNGAGVKLGTTENDVKTKFDSGNTAEIVDCEEIVVPKNMKILLFATEKLDVKTVPENVNFGKPTYSSDNEEIAVTDENGNVTAVMRGKCKITVTYVTSDGTTLEKTVDIEVYDEIVDITRDTDIVLTVKDGKIIAGDLEFTFTYKSGLVIKKTIQNATLGYRTDESGNFIGTISFIEDGKDYSFEVPVSLNFSGCKEGCNEGCGSGCGSAINGNHGLLTGYVISLILSAAFIFINGKNK